MHMCSYTFTRIYLHQKKKKEKKKEKEKSLILLHWISLGVIEKHVPDISARKGVTVHAQRQ